MPLPGFAGMAKTTLGINISGDQDQYNLFTALGSPTFPAEVFVFIQSASHIYSSDPAVPAWVDDGLSDGTTVFVVVEGRIQGAGGAGGRGVNLDDLFIPEPTNQTISGSGGGGGGGAGRIVGPKGDGGQPAQDGTPGTEVAGGTGGTGAVYSSGPNILPATEGGDGGVAMKITVPYTFININGEIWGGGGGGGGGQNGIGVGATAFDGGDGGDPGAPGTADGSGLFAGGAAGNAILYEGNGMATFLSGGSDPNVKGPVG